MQYQTRDLKDFFSAKNLIFLNKQIKAIYNKPNWPELDKSLPHVARMWCDYISYYRISDPISVLNEEFLKFAETFYKVEYRDSPDTAREYAYKIPVQKYAGQFTGMKAPNIEYQETRPMQENVLTCKQLKEADKIYNGLRLGDGNDIDVYDYLNEDEKVFLYTTYKQSKNSGHRNSRRVPQNQGQIFENSIKDSLVTGKPRSQFKFRESDIDNFINEETEYFAKNDPVGPNTSYAYGFDVVPKKYTKDKSPYNVAGVDLTYEYNDRQYELAYAGARP